MIDALQIMLNHSKGEVIHFFLPYTTDSKGKREWGKLFFRK